MSAGFIVFATVKILLKNVKGCKFRCNFLVWSVTWVIVHGLYFCCGACFSLRTCILYANTSMDKKYAIRCIRHKERIMWTCIYFTDEYVRILKHRTRAEVDLKHQTHKKKLVNLFFSSAGDFSSFLHEISAVLNYSKLDDDVCFFFLFLIFGRVLLIFFSFL